jgi:ribosomal protein S18 acetylase RimI-like enzyme
MMDRAAVLAAFDEQLRRNPPAGLDGGRVEREGGIVRVIGDGWTGVTWSDLDEQSADAAIAAQIERFAGLGRHWEWKHYSYDRPADLPARLRAAGLLAEPTEALLIAESGALALDTAPPEGVRLTAVTDRAGVRAMLALQREVFGDEPSGLEREMLAGLALRPVATLGPLALAGDRPVGAGRVEFNRDSDFAGIWGGCTHPDWRRRGIFRALVARRAALAAERDYRWLQVDAVDASRPTLLRLGFEQLAETTPFVPPEAR